MIVDAHFHLWDLRENYYPWLADGDRPTLVKDHALLRRNYLIADFLRDIDALDVVAAVHIQAQHDERDTVRETRWLQRVADDPASRRMPQAIVADTDLASPDAEQILEQHCAFANVRGIRYALHRRLHETPPHDPLMNPDWVRNFSLLRKYGLSFDMQSLPRQQEAAVALISSHPDTSFVLTHAAMPIERDEAGMALWRRSVRAYAAFPNVCIKLSGFGGQDPQWSVRSIDPIVGEVMDAFTPQRCMLASNFPVEGLCKPYAEIWQVFSDYFKDYSQAENEQLFWRNADRVYRLGL